MTHDFQIQLNTKLKESAKLMDDSLTLLCEATSLLVLARHFPYAKNVLSKAEMADAVRAGCLGCVIDVPAEKTKT